MKKCQTCGETLDLPDRPWSVNCGGDCRACMVEAGDPDEAKNLLVAVFYRIEGVLR